MDSTPIPNEGNQEVRIDVDATSKSSLRKKLAALVKDSYIVCIYRVPKKFRKSREEVYTPRVVSIGPLQHNKSHLQAMEPYKLRYLDNFIFKFGIDIDKLISYAYNKEDQVRGYYEDTSMFESEEFCQMILLDGIFVVQLFVKNLVHMRDFGDMLFENLWIASDLTHDMLLLENQLPLNFILGLYEFMDGTRVQQKSFYDLSLDYFKTVGNTTKLKSTFDCECSRHLLEFLLILHRPTSNKELLPLVTGKCEYTRSASKLHAAGVHFSVWTGESFEVSFDKKWGLLKLPRITVNDKTETFFRNLIAYEHCRHYEKYITSYVIFMGSLINTAEDVELLVFSEIIENLLGENQQVADLFNKLHKEVIEGQGDFYFAAICNDLNAYSRDYIHEWKSFIYDWTSSWSKWRLILIDDYFSNPWSIMAFMAAASVLVLTIIQTVCSLVDLKHG